MSIPTVAINENSPAGSDSANAGDNRIREFKTQNREILEVDHEYPSSGQSATAGQHKQVTLQEQADIGSGASGVPILGAQTDSAGDGAPELCFTDEADNDVFITDGGRLGNQNTDIIANTIDASAMFISGVNLINFIYPVGSIYANYAVSTNPGTLFGVGTWVAIEEEVIAGYKSGSAEFGAIGSYAGGEKTHLLTGAESGTAPHTHGVNNDDSTGAGNELQSAVGGSGRVGTKTSNASVAANASSAHNNIQPTYVAYLWRRTA